MSEMKIIRSKSMEDLKSFNNRAIDPEIINPENSKHSLFLHDNDITENKIPSEVQNFSDGSRSGNIRFSAAESVKIYRKIHGEKMSMPTINNKILEHQTRQQTLLTSSPLNLVATPTLIQQVIKWNDHKEITNPINLIKEVYTSGFGIKYLTRGLNNFSKILVASIEDSIDDFQEENKTKRAKAKDITLIIVKSFVLSMVVLLTIATATINSLFGSNNGNDVINKQDYPILHKILTTGVLLLKIGMYVTLGVSSAGFLTFLLNPALIFSYAGSYGPLVVSIFEAIMVSSLTFSQLTLIWVAVIIYACFRVAREFFVSLAKQKSNNFAKDALNKQISTIKAELIESIRLDDVNSQNLRLLSDDGKKIWENLYTTINTRIDQDVMQFIKEVKNLDATANNKEYVSQQLCNYKKRQLFYIKDLKNILQTASNQEKLFFETLQQEYKKFINDMIIVLESLQNDLKSATLLESGEHRKLELEITQKIGELNDQKAENIDHPVENIFATVENLVVKVWQSIETNNSNVAQEVKELNKKFVDFITICQDKIQLLEAKSKVIFGSEDNIFAEIKNFMKELNQNHHTITDLKIVRYQDLQRLQRLTSSVITSTLETKLQQLEDLVEQKITDILGDIDQYSKEKVALIEGAINQSPADVKSTLIEDVEEYRSLIIQEKDKIINLPRAETQDLTKLVAAIETFKKSCDEKSQNLMGDISKNKTIYSAFTKYREAVNAHNKIIDDIIAIYASLKFNDKQGILPKTPFHPKQYQIENPADFDSYYVASQYEDNKDFYELKLKENQKSLLKLCSSWNDRFKETLASKKIAVLSSNIPTKLSPAGYSNKNDIIDSERKRGDRYYQEVRVIEQLYSEASEDFQDLVAKFKTPLGTDEIMQSMKSIDDVFTCYSGITNYEAQWQFWVQNYENHKRIERSLSNYKQLSQDYNKLIVNWTEAERKNSVKARTVITDRFDTNHHDYTKNMQEDDPKKINNWQLIFIQQLEQSVEELKDEYEKIEFRNKQIEQFNIAIEATKLVNLKCLPEGEAKNALEQLQGAYKVAICNINLDMNKSEYNKQCTKTFTDYEVILNQLCAKYKAESKNRLLESVNTINTSLESNMVDVKRLSPTDCQEYNNQLQQLKDKYSEILTKINNINESTNVDDINTVYAEVQRLGEELKHCTEAIIAAQMKILQEYKEAIKSADNLIKELFKLEDNQSNGIIDTKQNYDFIENPKELYQLLKQYYDKFNLSVEQNLDYQTLQTVKKDVDNIKKIKDSVTTTFINAKSFVDWKSQHKDSNIIPFVEKLYIDCNSDTKSYLVEIVKSSDIDTTDDKTQQQKVENAQVRLSSVISMYKSLSVALGLDPNNACSSQQKILSTINNILSTINKILITPIFNLPTDSNKMGNIHKDFIAACNELKPNFTTDVQNYIQKCREYSNYKNKNIVTRTLTKITKKVQSPDTVEIFVNKLFSNLANYQSFINCAQLIVELQGKKLEVGNVELEHYNALLDSANLKLNYLASVIIRQNEVRQLVRAHCVLKCDSRLKSYHSQGDNSSPDDLKI